MAGEGGWRRSPVAGIVVALVIVVTLYFVVSRVACGRGEPDPMAGDAVTLICPQDGEVFQVPRAKLGLDANADHDQVQAKAADVPCPKCGKTGCVMPVYCRSCGKPFAPAKASQEGGEFRCPHCGKNPFGR